MIRLVVTTLAVAALASADAHAHTRPEQRSVVVQPEADAVVLLVEWTAPTGPLAPLIQARARRPDGSGRDLWLGLLARRALATLRVTVDGVPTPFEEVRAVWNHGSPLRITVLATARARRGSSITVSAQGSADTRLTWTPGASTGATAEPGPDVVRAASAPAGLWVPRVLELGLR